MTTRIALAVCLGVFTALPGLWLALTLVTNQVPGGGWIALALAVAVWVLLAWRALAQSVTLTSDTLVIRNILATEQVPLADVTEMERVRFVMKGGQVVRNNLTGQAQLARTP